jgi:hypothetical protein
MQVVLWDTHVDCVELNKTYLFKHLRVKGSKYEHYLNTPKADPFVAVECEEFEHPLVEIDQDLTPSSSITSQIHGICSASHNMVCAFCQKQVIRKPNKRLGVCENCNITQPTSKCHLKWTLKVLVKDSTQGNRNLSNDIVQCLMSNINQSFDLSKTSEDELIISILEADKSIKFTYDT